ncbi:MAG: rhomboid family intramembrane serine protease [Verrucomicrobiota bacterium]
MGIGDRAYMRDSTPERRQLTATVWTLGVLLTFGILGLIDWSTRFKGYSFLEPLELNNAAPQVWQWLTYALVHGGPWHFLMNAFGLWWLGNLVEESYGRRAYLQTLLGGVLLGAIVWWLTGIGGPRSGLHLLGISGGVYALMVVALLDRLETPITLLILFFPVTVKARWVLVFAAGIATLGWIFLELPGRHAWTFWNPAWEMNSEEAIAHSAHLGGLVSGWLMWRWLGRTIPEAGGAYVVQSQPMPASPEAYHPETATKSSATGLSRGQARAELDHLLDKISEKGFGSLTESEKRKLEELSARLR